MDKKKDFLFPYNSTLTAANLYNIDKYDPRAKKEDFGLTNVQSAINTLETAQKVCDMEDMEREVADAHSELMPVDLEGVYYWMRDARDTIEDMFSILQKVKELIRNSRGNVSPYSFLDTINLIEEQLEEVHDTFSFRGMLEKIQNPKTAVQFLAKFSFLGWAIFNYVESERAFVMNYKFEHSGEILRVTAKGTSLSFRCGDSVMGLFQGNCYMGHNCQIVVEEMAREVYDWMSLDEDGVKFAEVIYPGFDYSIFNMLNAELQYLTK